MEVMDTDVMIDGLYIICRVEETEKLSKKKKITIRGQFLHLFISFI